MGKRRTFGPAPSARSAPVPRPTGPPIIVRDRIKRFERVPRSRFVPSEKNFREHSDAQREAWRAMKREIGYAGAALAREVDPADPNGLLDLIDGHLRVDEADAGEMVPTLILDLTESEADTLRALFDPLGEMATVDPLRVQEVLDQVNVSSDALQVMMLELSGYGREQVDGPKDDSPAAPADGNGPPAMLLRPYEHYDYVMVVARTSMDWQALTAALGIEQVDSSAVPTVRKIGIGRVIGADKLMGIIRAQQK